MPGFDRTGPRGMGPRTGGGRGFCGRGYGFGRGYSREYPVGLTKDEEKEELIRIIKVYENELEQLKKRLENMK